MIPEPDFRVDPQHNYLLTETLKTRYVIANHHLKGCQHVIEVGGAQTPITRFISFQPQSILVVDPLIKPYQSDELNGHPCDVKHVARMIQEYPIERKKGGYGLVMLGFDLDVADSDERERLYLTIIELMDHAKVTILEHPPAHRPSVRQISYLLERAQVNEQLIMDLDFRQDKNAAKYTPLMNKNYLYRRLMVLTPKPKVHFKMGKSTHPTP